MARITSVSFSESFVEVTLNLSLISSSRLSLMNFNLASGRATRIAINSMVLDRLPAYSGFSSRENLGLISTLAFAFVSLEPNSLLKTHLYY